MSLKGSSNSEHPLYTYSKVEFDFDLAQLVAKKICLIQKCIDVNIYIYIFIYLCKEYVDEVCS